MSPVIAVFSYIINIINFFKHKKLCVYSKYFLAQEAQSIHRIFLPKKFALCPPVSRSIPREEFRTRYYAKQWRRGGPNGSGHVGVQFRRSAHSRGGTRLSSDARCRAWSLRAAGCCSDVSSSVPPAAMQQRVRLDISSGSNKQQPCGAAAALLAAYRRPKRAW